MTMDVGYEREYPEVRRRRSSSAEDWRWFRSQHGKELEARGITDPNPFDAQGRISPEAHKAMVDILQQRKTPMEGVSPSDLRPVSGLPLTEETVAEAPTYLDPDVWKSRGRRIGAAAQEAVPWIGLPKVIGRIKETRKEIQAEEAAGEDIAPWREGLRYGGATFRTLGKALDAVQETTSPIRGFLTTEVPGLKEPEIQKRFDIHRARGLDKVSALAAAYQQAEEAGEIPWYKSLPLSVLTDPLEAIPGFGLIGTGARGAARSFKSVNTIENLVAKVPKTHKLGADASPERIRKLQADIGVMADDLASGRVTKSGKIEKYRKYIAEHTGLNVVDDSNVLDEALQFKPLGIVGRTEDEIVQSVPMHAERELEDLVSKVPIEKNRAGVSEFISELQGNVVAPVSKTEKKLPLKKKDVTARVQLVSEQLGITQERLKLLINRYQAENIDATTPDKIEKALLNKDRLGALGTWLVGLPGGAKLGRVFTPALLALRTGNEALKEGVLFRLLQQQQEAKTSARLIRYRTNYVSAKFDVDDTGALKLVGDEGLKQTERRMFSDVVEKADDLFAQKMIPEAQYAWIKEAQGYINSLAANYERVSGTRLAFKANYWPRFVQKNMLDDDSKKIFGETKLGEIQSIQKQRHLDTMQEGIDKGINYLADPTEVLNRYANSLNKMTREQVFRERLLDKAATRTGTALAIKSTRHINPTDARAAPEWMSTRGWSDLEISDAAQKQLAQVLGVRKGGVLSKAETTAAVPKLIMAGSFDTGQLFIQGLPLLFYRPTAWAQAMYVTLRTLTSRNPQQFYNNWMTSNLGKEIQNFRAYGGDISDISEFYQALGVVRGVPVVGGVTARFGAGFHAFMGVGRVKMFSAMDTMIRRQVSRKGIRPDAQTNLDQELFRAMRMVETMMGGTSTKSLGLSATQRQVENAFLFFAPRYTRAVFGSFGHLFGEGYAAKEARAVLAQLAAGGMFITAGAIGAKAIAAGKTEEEAWEEVKAAIQPVNKREFMSIKFGDQYYGVAGGYRSLITSIANSIPITAKAEENWDKIIQNEDPIDKMLRNPLVMFARAKGPVTTGTVVDFIDNQDYLGSEFTIEAFTENPKKLLNAIANRAAPIPVQQFYDVLSSGYGLPAATKAGAAEFVGLRNLPPNVLDTQRELGSDLLEQAGIVGTAGDLLEKRGYEGFGWDKEDLEVELEDLPIWDLDPLTQADIERNPEYSALQTKWREIQRDRNPKKGDYYAAKSVLQEALTASLVETAEKSFNKNSQQPLKHYREKRKIILHDYFRDTQKLRDDAEARGVFGKRDPDGPFDRAKKIHDQLLYEDDKDTVIAIMGLGEEEYVPLGEGDEFNFDERERRMDYLVEAYGQKYLDDLKLVARSKLPEVERTYREDMDYLASTGYWEADEALARKEGVELELARYRELQNIDEPKAKEFLKLKVNDILRTRVINKVREIRKNMRKADITNGEYRLDNILYKYGYTSVLITDEDPSKRKIYR